MPGRVKRREQIAIKLEAARMRLERAGVSTARSFGQQARIDALRAYEQTRRPAMVRRAIQDTFLFGKGFTYADLVGSSMMAAHLAGIARTHQVADAYARSQRRGRKLARNPFAKAVQVLTGQVGMPKQTVRELMGRYADIAVQSVLKQLVPIFNSVEQAAGQGTAAIRAAFDAAGMTPQNDYALVTLFRTQTQLAYTAGRLVALQEIADLFGLWGFTYVTVGDDKVRPLHAAMDGVTRPKDDPIWQTWHPPNGYNCRCSSLEIFGSGTPTAELPPEAFEGPDEGFAFNPMTLVADIVDVAGTKLRRRR